MTIERRLSPADRLVAVGAVALALSAGAWSWLGAAAPPGVGPSPPPGVCAPGAGAALASAPAILVRAPVNYDAVRPYPLLVAFPPAGMSRTETERYYGLTAAATQLGFLVAYSDAIPPSKVALTRQAEVAGRVASAFCVDANRIAYFGHSDGGALAESLALLPGAPRPRAIFASAAGVTGADLQATACNAAPSTMIVHNAADAFFPDFGRGAAAYWAACAHCAPQRLDDLAEGCLDFAGCDAGIAVRYCAVASPHERFPPVREAALAFLAGALRAVQTGDVK